MANYKVLVGVDYAGKRAEPGAIVSDLPSKSVSWLVEQGIVERVEGTESKSKEREPKSPSEGDR